MKPERIGIEILFEDLVPGTVSTYGGHVVDRDAMVAFAREFDAQPFHTDETSAARSAVGELIASGWYTCACALQMRMLCDAWLNRSTSRGGPGIIRHRTAVIELARQEGVEPRYGVSPGFRDLKWLKPVYPGDVIRFDTQTVDKRLSASRPRWGLVFSRNSGWNAAGERVFEFTGSGFWGLRDG